MNILLSCAILVFIYMTTLFIIGSLKRNNSIIDVGWGIGFMIIAYYTLFTNNLFLARHILATTLVTLWGLRISLHILQRNWGRGEDPRYQAWRASWGTHVLTRSFFQIYMLQGIMLFIIAYPIILTNMSSLSGLRILDAVGAFIWMIGFFFEVIGDYQLDQFIRQPSNKGKVLQTGLWRYTRHPNYFGEATMWWGIFIIAFAATGSWVAIVSPITITILVRYISGVPLLEKMFENNPEYRQYQQKTSIFLPWITTK